MTLPKWLSPVAACAVMGLCIIGIVAIYRTEPETIEVQQTIWQGHTMGTMYAIKVSSPLTEEQQQTIDKSITARLAAINAELSLFDTNSTLSQFNRTGTNEFLMSPMLQTVLETALLLAEKSSGAFDPTIEPLVSLWGFGPDWKAVDDVNPVHVGAVRKHVGWHHLSYTSNRLSKRIPDLKLDLGAIAKGYGVDQIAATLETYKLTNYVVEIGGEVRCSGSYAGHPWRIGIQRPHYHAAPGKTLSAIVQPQNAALATSGDYQNFYTDKAGNIRSHIIDPRTGYPAPHALASVTVIATNCMLADGLATALYVLGTEEGLNVLKNFPHTSALFIERTGTNSFRERFSRDFKMHARIAESQ